MVNLSGRFDRTFGEEKDHAGSLKSIYNYYYLESGGVRSPKHCAGVDSMSTYQ